METWCIHKTEGSSGNLKHLTVLGHLIVLKVCRDILAIKSVMISTAEPLCGFAVKMCYILISVHRVLYGCVGKKKPGMKFK